ncbi:MAG TPA: ABC transporter permease [Hyphomicrobiales bacterium]|nr:ABC transporter permease [Hyphomicrobiales bacterium]
MNQLLHDIAYAWRNLLRQPATSLLIIVTLALGIGINTAMISMVAQVALGSLPYTDGDRIVQLEQTASIAGRSDRNWSIPTLENVRAQTTAFAAIASYSQLPYAIQGPRGPVQGMGGGVSWNFFEVLGVQPLLGRGFDREDDVAGAEPVALLSYAFWNQEYGRDPAAVGSTLEIMNVAYTVIGVLPELPPFPHANAVWIPETTDPYRAFSPNAEDKRGYGPLHAVFGRLQDGADLSRASAELGITAQRLGVAYPDIYPEGYHIVARPLRSVLLENADATFALMAGLSFLVLVIAAANIASLVLGRTLVRSQEFAIREAVGANPAMIVRQLLAESVLFSAMGGLVAVVIAYGCLRLLADFAAGYTPLASEIHMNGTVLLLALGTVLVTGCFIGIMSTMTSRDINKCLKEGGDKVTASSLGVKKRRLLLLTQYTLAFVLLTTSALIISSLYRLHAQDAGYEASRILVVNLPLTLQPGDDWRVMAGDFNRQLLEEVRAVPGVNGAAVLSGEPLLQDVAYLSLMPPFSVEGRVFADGAAPVAVRRAVSEGFFGSLDIPLLHGRDFTAADDEEAPRVAIVSEGLAQKLFPKGDALGQHIRFGYSGPWLTIVGVVADIRSQGLDRIDQAAIYLSYWQNYSESLSLYVSSTNEPNALTSVVTAIVHDLNPRQPVERAVTLDALKSEWMEPARLRAIGIGVFGALSLIVTFCGVIGVVSYNINQRMREIGIHMATGATPANIMRLFLSEGLRVYAIGLLLGLVSMLALAPFLTPLLYQTAAVDIGLYSFSVLVLTLMVLGALYLPARKAGALHPMEALHAE